MSLRKERAAKGLCPQCGREAAPFYLCDECHRVAQVDRFLTAMVRKGLMERVGVGRYRAASGDPAILDRFSYRGMDYGKRDEPRLRGVPVDVETELFGIFERAGRPLSVEEVMMAWVRLRPRKGRPAAEGMAAMITAEEKRARKRAIIAALAKREA